MPPLVWRAFLGFAATAAFYGWGTLFDGLVQGFGSARAPVARGALGLAVVLALGGVLNVFHLLIAPVYWLLLGTGLAGAAAAFGKQWRHGTFDWPWCVLVLVAGLLVLPVYLQAVDSDRLNASDDFYSYLVMPMRILQLGTLQPDVFNYRAAVSGPGGMAFLQAPVIGLFGVTAVRLADQGTGLLLLIGTSATLFRRFAAPVPAAAVLLAGAVLLAEHALVNVTSYFTNMTLLIGLFHVLVASEDDRLARPVFAALMLAGVATLKNTSVPFAALLCFLFVLREWGVRRPRLVRNTLVALVTVSVVVLAWYLPRLSAGVHLLPLRHGDGPDEVSLSYMFWWLATGGAWNWAYFVVFVVLWGAALFASRGRPESAPALLLGLAVLGGAAVLNYASGGVAITRYTQPLFLVACLACTALAVAGVRPRWLLAPTTLLLACSFAAFRLPPPTGSGIPEAGFNRVAGYVFLGVGQPATNYFRHFAATLIHTWRGPPDIFPTGAQAGAMRRLQGALAPGATALVCVDMPFLLDFARNRIYVADYAAAGPDPGLPLESTDCWTWVDYYRRQSVRYLVYAYRTEAGFPAGPLRRRLENPRFTPWQRALVRGVPAFHEQLLAIAARWPKVYDDGNTLVVDLAGPAAVR